MKLKVIAAAAAALAAGSAFALPPSATPAYILYAGGASAQANQVLWATYQLFNNLDSYTDGACGAQSGNYRIFFGTAKSNIQFAGGALVPAGANVLVYYGLNGGAFPNGILPQATGSQLTFPSITTATACTGVTGVNPTYAIPSGFSAVTAVPSFGMSDEEVAVMNFVDNTPSAPLATQVLSATQVANINQDPVFDTIYGVVVTPALYTSATNPKTNFTRAEVEAILSGVYTDWSQLTDDNGNILPAGPITLLDRAPGAGVKAATNEYFLNYPGSVALGGDQIPGNIAFGTTGTLCDSSYDDINYSSSGKLITALQTAASKNCRAIGILDAGNPPALNQVTPGTNAYYFAKIHGADPGINGTSANYATEINGSYDLFYTAVYLYRTKQVGTNPQNWLGDGSGVSSLISAYKQELQSNQIPGGVTGSGLPNGVPGVLLDPLVTGSFGACTTRWSRNKNSTAPLVPVYDYQLDPTTPTCNDPL